MGRWAIRSHGDEPRPDPVPAVGGSELHGADAGKFRNAGGSCVNSLSQLITFDFDGASILVDGKVIWTVSFNTTNSGYHPFGATACRTDGGPGCGYDSLNVGALTYGNSPYAGGELNADDVIWNKTADSISGLLPTSGWTGNAPLAQITTG